MAEKATVARPYAKAAFAHARDKNTLDAWSVLANIGHLAVLLWAASGAARANTRTRAAGTRMAPPVSEREGRARKPEPG